MNRYNISKTLNNEEMRSENDKDEIKTSSEIDIAVTDDIDKQQEEIKQQDMTLEQLQEIVSENQKTIENNEEILKQELLQKIQE